MAGIFITSTGTGIGKTHLTARLLAYDRTQHAFFTASKPIISGWPSDINEINQTDTGILLLAQQKECTQSTIEELSPWRFRASLSPDMAAKREGRKIDIPGLLAYSHQKFQQAKMDQKIHLMEGVGGVMVPLAGTFTVIDWLEQLGCPCLLVVGSYLGTLSHTLTAVRVLEMKKVPILAIIVNESPNSTVSLQETGENIQALAPYPVFWLEQQENQTGKALISLYSQISTKMGHCSLTI